MRATSVIIAIAVAGAASAISPANAQGTDCRYPSQLTVSEITVCRHPEILALEERLTRRYFRIRSELRGRELYQFEQDQAAWREARRTQCGYNVGCLDRFYRRRLDELRAYRD